MAQQVVMNGLNVLSLPAGGGGAVTSVNGQVGAVVLGAADVGAVPTSRTVTAGTGLTGGGDLSANRSFAVAYGTTAGTATQGNDTRVVNAVQTTDYTAFADVSSLGTNISAGTPHFQQRNEPGGITRLKGQIVLGNTTFAANSVLATLNASGRPVDPVTFLTRTKVGNVQTLINIATNGQVTNQSSIAATGTDSINFDGWTFDHA